MSDSDKKPITRTRRRWAFRLVGLGIGFALLAALELFIRLTGWGLAIGSHTGYLKPIGLPFFQCQQEAGGQKTCRTSKYYPKPYANNEQFRMPKPKSTVRIFCVVASTTAGVPFFKPGAFPYFLSMALETVAPYPRHEVINAGHAGASSLEVGLIVSGLYKYDPDWIVIYTGNNEFLVHGSKVNSERHSRLRYFFKRWHYHPIAL